MILHRPLALLVLFSFALFSAGCQCGNSAKPTNPFAQNQTVPPPATFSSQESYLGQTPGTYIPQTPATVFPSSPSTPSPQSAITPSNTATGTEKATLFSAAKESDWTPVTITTTSQTAFQAMEAKVAAARGEIPATGSESLIAGTSHIVTTITDESAALPEPPLLLYSGQYVE